MAESSSLKADICIICGKPAIKNSPLRKCTSCDKLVHRRCTHTPVGSQAVTCSICLPSKQKIIKENEKNTNKVGTSSSQRGKASTLKDTTSQRLSTASRHSLKSTALPRRSYISSKNLTSNEITTNKSNCTCTDALKDMLNTWEHKIQAKFDELYKKFDDTTGHINNIMVEELTSIRNTLKPLPEQQKTTSQSTQHTSTTGQLPVSSSLTGFSTIDIDTSNSHGTCASTSRNHCNYQNINNFVNSSPNSNLINNNNTLKNLNKNNLETKNNNNTPTNHTFIKSHLPHAQNSNITFPISSDEQQSIISNKNHNSSPDSNSNKSSVPNPEILTHILENNHNNNYNNTNNRNKKKPAFQTRCEHVTKTSPEAFEVYISGFMTLTISDDLKGLCYSILHGISPMLNISEIANVRLLHTRSATDTLAQASDVLTQPTGFPAIIVQLTTSSRVKQVMSLKREINYYNTRDLDLSHLSKELATRVPTSKLIINDVLPNIEYQRFKSLRRFAKNLGFKYVWHRYGRFLTRWNNNGQAHFFNNLSDLDIIKAIYNRNTDTNNTNLPLTALTPTETHNQK